MTTDTGAIDIDLEVPSADTRKKGASRPSTRHRIGTLLVQSGALTPAQLTHALSRQSQLGLPLGRVLIELNYVSDTTLRQALSEQLGIPFLDLDTVVIDKGLARVINKSYARRHSLLPVAQVGTSLTVAMDDPTEARVVNELRYMTRSSITVVTATSQAIQRAFGRLYEEVPEPTDLRSAEFITPLEAPADLATGPVFIDEQVTRRADELLRAMLFKAFQERASDLHLEMLQGELRIRYRVDGVLRQPHLGSVQAAASKSSREIVSRIKILAKLDIAERRRPQDGSFQVAVDRGGQKVHIDLRVSVVPSYFGESVVIRILDRAAAPKALGDIELAPDVVRRLEQLLRQTTGILLVTGPTGSGKSTTLSACLRHLHRPEVRILTAEDPVEYVYEGISQSEVNTAIGNTFAAYLRAFLRHDPEVIMVGEIRDRETAEMAFRAAQTGHLLLSTMHTTSAIAALPRLFDLEIEPSLIASSLIGVLSQRLARKLCEACKVPVTDPPERLGEFFARPPGMTFFHGRGCEVCGFTGYRGRMPLVDLWVPDEQDLLLVTRQASFSDIRASATRTTLSMAQDAHDRLNAGTTTIDELLRVLPYSVIVDHRERYSN